MPSIALQCVSVLLTSYVHVTDKEVIKLSEILTYGKVVIDLEGSEQCGIFLVCRDFFVADDALVIVVTSKEKKSYHYSKYEFLHDVFILARITRMYI